jgi:hypothetical protein
VTRQLREGHLRLAHRTDGRGTRQRMPTLRLALRWGRNGSGEVAASAQGARHLVSHMLRHDPEALALRLAAANSTSRRAWRRLLSSASGFYRYLLPGGQLAARLAVAAGRDPRPLASNPEPVAADLNNGRGLPCAKPAPLCAILSACS